MKKWLNKLNETLDRFMAKRYGNDELNTVLLILCVFLVIFAAVEESQPICVITLIVCLFAEIRFFSKNINRRQKEFGLYLRAKHEIKRVFSEESEKLADRVTYKYVKCPHCGTVIKLPRGAGKVTITCPKCNNKFNKHI